MGTNCPVGWERWVEECLREVSCWDVPPNWAKSDWLEEMKSVALFALWVAICSYDSNRQVPMDKFVKVKVKAALLQRYREEWRFAKRCCNIQLPSDTENSEEGSSSVEKIPDEIDETIFWWHIEVRDILSRLPPEEHYLLERLFIDGASEQQVAEELGISQPTVSRWKRKVLQKLRNMLSEQT